MVVLLMTERSYASTLSQYRGWVDSHINVTVWIGVASLLAVTLFGAEIAHILSISSRTVVVGFGAAAFWCSSVVSILLLFYSYGERQKSM
jgi:hypothetical protein